MANYYTNAANAARNQLLQQGQQIQTDIGGDIGGYQGAYGSNYNLSQEALARLAQQPGYSAAEQANIMRQPEFEGLLNQDYSSNFLTPEEGAAMSGDPRAAFSYYSPDILTGIGQAGAQATRGQIAGTQGALQQNTAQMGQALNAAIDPSLGASQGYRDAAGNVLTTTANRVEGAIDPAKLGITDAYTQAMQFTPQNQQDIETAAGTSEGQRYKAQEDALTQKAMEQGNTSPAALAALQERLNIQEGSAAGDAMTNARIAAKQAAMGAAGNLEQTRLGSEQFQTQAGTQAGEALGNLAQNAVQQTEQTRMAGAQDIANRQAQAALATGQMGQQTGEFSGQQGLTNEQQIAAQQLGIEQANQATGQNLALTADQLAAQRAAQQATNRQNVNLQNQGNQFNRGFQVQSGLSQNAGNIAQANMAGRGQYLQGVTGQQQQAQQGAQTARGQQIGAYGATAGAGNQALQTSLGASQMPSGVDKAIGLGIGALSSAAGAGYEFGGISGVGGPEVATLGERGPELVLPLNRNGLDPAIDATQQGLAKPQVQMLSASSRYDDNSGAAPKGFDYTAYSGPFGSSSSLTPSTGQKIGKAVGTFGNVWDSTYGVNAPQGTGQRGAYGGGSAGGGQTDPTTGQKIGSALSGLGKTWNQIYGARSPYGGGTPQFAGGKIVTKPTRAIVGEHGPEAVVPLGPHTKDTKTSTNLLVPEKGVKSRYQHPRGPAGPHGPERALLPLKGLTPYR